MIANTRTVEDRAVSPVVGVVLMMAVTVALAATVLVGPEWLEYEPAPYASARTDGADMDENLAIDTLRVTLTGAENAPLDATLRVEAGMDRAEFAAEGWDIGEARALPCLGEGSHTLVVSADSTVVADVVLECGEAPGAFAAAESEEGRERGELSCEGLGVWSEALPLPDCLAIDVSTPDSPQEV
jgi:flagellin-like protein